MDRVVIITGSTRGIGFSTAIEFLKNGDRVIIFCRHKDHASKAKKRLVMFGPPDNIMPLVGDVRSAKNVKSIVDSALKHFRRIDVLINNAGIATYKSVEKTNEREWDDIVETNLKGTFLFIRQVLPVMKKQGSGVIINISSAMGVEGEANFSAYCASKFGVIGLTQAVSEETLASGLKVYAVLPWAVNTTLLSKSDFEINPSEVLPPEYVAGKIFEAAKGKKKSGTLIEVYC